MEVEYGKQVDQIFTRIEKAFQNVDPDVAECEISLGALILILGEKSKCILSTQPSVKQIWLALASEGRAYHFNLESSSQKWMDDKNQGIELLSFLEKYLKEVTKQAISLK